LTGDRGVANLTSYRGGMSVRLGLPVHMLVDIGSLHAGAEESYRAPNRTQDGGGGMAERNAAKPRAGDSVTRDHDFK
jgi:hypothetical protein